jgi:hypothetical protein
VLLIVERRREGYGALVAEQLFLFIQMEFPWRVGPEDGRYLLRTADGEPEYVVVFRTAGRERRVRARMWRGTDMQGDQPAEVQVTQVTIVDPVSVTTETQAQRWLADCDGERESSKAAGVLAEVLSAHRAANADPFLHELSPAQALVIRAGWGTGAQVADGRFSYARELKLKEPRSRGRSAVLRPQERLARLLSAREQALLCEEFALRARADLDFDRLRLAALELERAYTFALQELPEEDRSDLRERLEELRGLHDGVMGAAEVALDAEGEPDRQTVSHALERLQALLRARTAAGFQR